MESPLNYIDQTKFYNSMSYVMLNLKIIKKISCKVNREIEQHIHKHRQKIIMAPF